ncbi:hypothetical protein P389DRAFT_111061 [Cystobasidium minutum MCA 4210]|uniref:uncharacterized protein n=1 Tax=Cystobasidium minutum MCA 4210 TaxID=1397322 RepID=UPI0034CFA76D|eukprot:jgi/Rhomi1/111061/CE111060_293
MMTSLALVSPSTSSISDTSSNVTTSTSSQNSTTSTSTEPCSLCDGCGLRSESKRLRRCGRCKAKWYCSQRCQREDWHAHQYCCSRLPATLEIWRGNKTSAFGADYMKRVELADAWAKTPPDEEFCRKHNAYYQLVGVFTCSSAHD